MMDKRILMLSAVTVTSALGIGFYMQQSAPSRSLERPGQYTEMHEVPAEPETAAFKIENITLTSVPRTDPQEVQADTAQRGADVGTAAGCTLSAKAVARPEAMVELSVSAPCQAGERLTVHHHGMMFTVSLDATGQFTQQVPALATTAVFIIEPEYGMAEVVAAEVLDLKDVDRVVLQWSGNSGFEIHARENGAEYGAPGHVWHGSDAGESMGHILRLGDGSQLAPRMAEIYSIPRSADRSGFVELSVETEITAINCGRDIEAQVLTLNVTGEAHRLRTRDLTLAMPDCTAEGDFLVLNNLLENLKIAAN